MGLKNIQNKKTNREIINSVNKTSKQIEFEFALDHTMMVMNSNYKFRFSELEIESKASGNEAKFEKFVNEFTVLFVIYKQYSCHIIRCSCIIRLEVI